MNDEFGTMSSDSGTPHSSFRTHYSTFDISADLPELAQTPVAVVCAGAKAILDLPATLEWLETWGVPVVGYGTDEFPAFYSRHSGLPVDVRVDSPEEAAAIVRAKTELGLAGGVLICVPVPEENELPADEANAAIAHALAEANAQGVRGKDITPFLLARIVELTGERSLRANLALLENNVRVAGFREGSDYLPKRFSTLPADGEGSEGSLCEIDLMLGEYYAERGWVNGVVPESKLKELEII